MPRKRHVSRNFKIAGIQFKICVMPRKRHVSRNTINNPDKLGYTVMPRKSYALIAHKVIK